MNVSASAPARVKKVAVLALLCAAAAAAQQYTKSGELVLPKDYRYWVFLSSGIGMTYSNDPNAHPTFGNVFVNPAAYKGFLKTGTWPDKTVLLIENRASGSHPSNKDGKFQTELTGFEAHVKDSTRGGRAFYMIPKNAQSGRASPVSAGCVACHDKNASTDTTFVQFYPSLIETAKKMGTYRATGEQ